MGRAEELHSLQAFLELSGRFSVLGLVVGWVLGLVVGWVLHGKEGDMDTFE